jgi:hypothetical protein
VSRIPMSLEICRSETSVALSANDFCGVPEGAACSPIDDLTGYFRSVMPLGDRDTLDKNNVLGRVLLLGLVSGTETYFRSLLAKLVIHCPFCCSHAGSQMMSLASAQYYSDDDLGFGILERISFSSSGELGKATQKLTGLVIDTRSSVSSAIEQFELLCHFRHAAVHARGELNTANLAAIGIGTAGSENHLIVRLKHLHLAADVCLNAARAYNRYMFKGIMNRWIEKKKLTGNWATDRQDFSRMLSIFRSREDGYGGPAHTAWLYNQLRPTITRATTRNSTI